MTARPPRPSRSATLASAYAGWAGSLPAEVTEDLRRSIPGSTLAVVPDAGHVCNPEASEAFNQTVRSFLDNQPREG